MFRISAADGFFVLVVLASTIPDASGQAKRDARPVQFHLAEAQQAMAAKQFDVASRELNAVLKIEPGNVEARANLGVVQFLQGEFAEAGQSLRTALRLQPSLWKAQAILGLCERFQGRPDAALPMLERSFPHLQEPTWQSRVGMTLVELLYQRHDLDKALEVLRALEKRNPRDVDVLYVNYRIHTDLASESRDKLALIAPDSARMHQLLAQHLVSAGNIKEAAAQYREALRIDPRLPGAHFELGEAILEDSTSDEGQREAQKEFETALALNPSDARSECRLGALSSLRGDAGAAMQHFSRAAELDPHDAEAHVGLGKVLASTGQVEKALDHLLTAVRLDPLNAQAHFRLSQLYRRMGRGSDAEQERARFEDLHNARDRLRSAYWQVYKKPGASRVLDPDVPQ